MTELLPCPFCGGEAEVHAAYDIYPVEVDGYFVICRNKNCTVWPETDEYLTEAEAIAAWNTRAERTCENVSKWKDERLKCSECGCITDFVSYEDEPYMMTDEGATIPNYCPNCGARVIGG